MDLSFYFVWFFNYWNHPHKLTFLKNQLEEKTIMYHNSKINDLHSRLSSKEMLQNLLYFKKKHVYFLFFISGNFNFFTNMNALVYDHIDQGIHKWKMKVARNEEWKKLCGFSFHQNIENFEAFLWNLKFSVNHLFWRCDTIKKLL